MGITRNLFLLAAVLLGVGVVANGAPPPTVTRIEIDSRWGGLGEPQKFQIEIAYVGGRYRSTNAPVDQSKVDALVSALRSPVLDKPDLANLGLTPAWLERHELDSESVRRKWQGAGTNQQLIYRRTLRNTATLEKIVPELLNSYHTDDSPGVLIQVMFDNGSSIVVCAAGQHPFMLPWRISAHCIPSKWAKRGAMTYNADISRAVASLVPRSAVNQPRLAGDDMGSELGDAVMDSIESKWNTLDAENRAGASLAKLRDHFQIVSAEINPYHHPEYGRQWDDKKSYAENEREAQVNLHVDLVSPRLPTNLHYALVLPFQHGNVGGTERFLVAAEPDSSALLSVGWLAQFIRSHPYAQMMIAYVGDASMGQKAMETFTHDMHAIGKGDLVAEVARVRTQAVLLKVGDQYYATYWIVLPDRRVILWRYDGSRDGLLKWTAKDFSIHECVDYQDAADSSGCIGAVVSPDGNLLTH
jgi:hypothetical protein